MSIEFSNGHDLITKALYHDSNKQANEPNVVPFRPQGDPRTSQNNSRRPSHLSKQKAAHTSNPGSINKLQSLTNNKVFQEDLSHYDQKQMNAASLKQNRNIFSAAYALTTSQRESSEEFSYLQGQNELKPLQQSGVVSGEVISDNESEFDFNNYKFDNNLDLASQDTPDSVSALNNNPQKNKAEYQKTGQSDHKVQKHAEKSQSIEVVPSKQGRRGSSTKKGYLSSDKHY